MAENTEQYTPDEKEMEDRYVAAALNRMHLSVDGERKWAERLREDFQRGLTAHDARVKAEALKVAANDVAARANGPELIAAADRWGGYYSGVRTAMQNEESTLRETADRFKQEARR